MCKRGIAVDFEEFYGVVRKEVGVFIEMDVAAYCLPGWTRSVVHRRL